MTSALESELHSFVAWVEAHITGDEKGQAQIFLDRFFKALGHGGCLDVGGRPEWRIRKGKEEGGGTAFADYVWKPLVLIEMKKRGTDLSRHYRQAFDYWTRLVPGRPRYAILCNFDEFWIFDFETQLDIPLDKVAVNDLPRRYGAIAFLLKQPQTPVFGNDQEAVTRAAADKLADCFKAIVKRTPDERPLAQRFILQTLVALFSEDIGLLEKYFVTRILDECRTPPDTYDLLGGLFEAMNTRGGIAGGRYRGVSYFNGGLFREPARLELTIDELELLKLAAKEDWAKVRPEIFGTIFEHTLTAEERRATGAHFTTPADIMKIVGPTLVAPWRERIESARSQAELHVLLENLQQFRVLDPACGSGNFLYIAYREMKRLEARVIERLSELSKKGESGQRRFGFVTALQFFGMDINPFAVELAKVTMMIARKLAIDELHVSEPALPLDNLDSNFRAVDALVSGFDRTQWPKADVIIGNPPFTGAKRMKPALGPDYVMQLRKLYPEIPGMADLCVYWIRRANDALPECSAADPCAGRAGLVGTQNIRNNQSRAGGLDHVIETGSVVEAVDNQPWSGEANVHVSIVNWAKTKDAQLLPKLRRLWYVTDDSGGTAPARRRGSGPANKRYELAFREVPHISSSLSDKTDVSGALVLTCNKDPKRVYQGITPGHEGFVLTQEERELLIENDPDSAAVVFPYLIGRELVSGDGKPSRFVIDFGSRTVLEAKAFAGAHARVESTVLQDRMEKAEKGKDAQGNMRPHHKQFLDRWWALSWGRAEMKDAIRTLNSRYIAASRTQSWPFIYSFVSSHILPGDKLQVFALDDDYSFGVLQSQIHSLWYQAKTSRLKNEGDYNYSTDSVFDTFPWPQSPSEADILHVAEAARTVRAVRENHLPSFKGGLRELYSTLSSPGRNALRDAHSLLDSAVKKAYGFDAKEDPLLQLLRLNGDVARRVESGASVAAPGIPKSFPGPARLLSVDCISA